MKEGKSILDMLIGIIVLVATGFYFVWLRTEVVDVGYKISKAQENKKLAIEESKNLNLEISALKSPLRIELLAKKMELTYPTSKQMVEISVEDIR
ncbi:MAG TPA: hypothetical protein VII00_09245 [bacterium]